MKSNAYYSPTHKWIVIEHNKLRVEYNISYYRDKIRLEETLSIPIIDYSLIALYQTRESLKIDKEIHLYQTSLLQSLLNKLWMNQNIE